MGDPTGIVRGCAADNIVGDATADQLAIEWSAEFNGGVVGIDDDVGNGRNLTILF